MTPLIRPTPAQGRCISFWYFLNGNEQSNLNVILRVPGDGKDSYIWQLTNTAPAATWLQVRKKIIDKKLEYTK